MSVLEKLKELGGCIGGITIYRAAKLACECKNIQRKKRKLNLKTIARYEKYFPNLDLSKVRICINCSLPGNWFTSSNNISAMTFGYTIYFKGSNIQKTDNGLRLLMHELVHVDQLRRYLDSESAFACQYGEGYLKAGSYRDNLLEVEAYDFVSNHPIPPPPKSAVLEWWEEKDFKGKKHRRELFPNQHGKCLRLVHSDAMKSLQFKACAGWKLEIYDNPGGKKTDDWAEVTFPPDPNVKVVSVPKIGKRGEVEVKPSGNYKLHYKNGLPGKVSSIKHFGP